MAGIYDDMIDSIPDDVKQRPAVAVTYEVQAAAVRNLSQEQLRQHLVQVLLPMAEKAANETDVRLLSTPEPFILVKEATNRLTSQNWYLVLGIWFIDGEPRFVA